MVLLDPPVCERPMFGEGYDVFGIHWTFADAASLPTPGQKPIYDDIENWRDQLRIPKVERFDWDTFRREVDKLDTENNLVTMQLTCGLFERGTMLTSFENCLMDIFIDPDNYRDMMGAIADYKIALIDKMSEYVHIDVLTYHDDWGTNTSTFMAPELWREVTRPHTQRIYDAMKAHDITICQHSCGSVGPFVGDMIEMGAHMWDAQAGANDIAALARQYGDKIRITVNDYRSKKRPAAEGAKDAPPPMTTLYPAYKEVPEFLYN